MHDIIYCSTNESVSVRQTRILSGMKVQGLKTIEPDRDFNYKKRVPSGVRFHKGLVDMRCPTCKKEWASPLQQLERKVGFKNIYCRSASVIAVPLLTRFRCLDGSRRVATLLELSDEIVHFTFMGTFCLISIPYVPGVCFQIPDNNLLCLTENFSYFHSSSLFSSRHDTEQNCSIINL